MLMEEHKNYFYIENTSSYVCTRKGAPFFIDIAHYKSLNKIINFLEKIYFKKNEKSCRCLIMVIKREKKYYDYSPTIETFNIFALSNHQLFSNLNEEEYTHTHACTVKM